MKKKASTLPIGWILAIGTMVCMSIYPITFRQLGNFTVAPVAITSVFITSLLLSLPSIFWWQLKQPKKTEKPPAKNNYKGYLWITLMALASLAGNWFYFLSVNILDPAIAISIQRTELIFVTLLGAFFLKEAINHRVIVAIVLAMVGIIQLQGGNLDLRFEQWQGILVTICSAFSFALMLLFSKFGLNYFTANQLNTARLILLCVCLISIPYIREGLAVLPLEGWLFASLSALVGPFGSRLFMTYALNYLSMAKILLATMLAPSLSAVWQLLFLGITINSQEIFGSFLIISGICYVIYPALKRHISSPFKP